jgi:DNA-binding XRE family transcriptional regulator
MALTAYLTYAKSWYMKRKAKPQPAESEIPFSATMKEWRDERGYTQVAASERLGVNLRTLQGWEAGRFAPVPLLKSLLIERMTRLKAKPPKAG